MWLSQLLREIIIYVQGVSEGDVLVQNGFGLLCLEGCVKRQSPAFRFKFVGVQGSGGTPA